MGCCTCSRCWIFVKAIVVRLVFALHIGLCTLFWYWYDTQSYVSIYLGAALGGSAILLLFIEGIFTLCRNKYGEWKRFSPCILIYLLGSVSLLFMIEWLVAYSPDCESGYSPECESGASTCTADENNKYKRFYSKILEQSMVVILVVGRWFLPRGTVSRERLSDMLLAYIGAAADMLEFLTEGIQTKKVQCDEILTVIVLGIWAVSLLQFAFGLNFFIGKTSKDSSSEVRRRFGTSEVWTILATMTMQDGPYLLTRIYLMATSPAFLEELDSNDRMFFAIKNLLVLMLSTYRLWILIWSRPEQIRTSDSDNEFEQDNFSLT